MSKIQNVRKGDELNVDLLLPYISKELGIHVGKVSIQQFSGGYSNLTYLLTLENDTKYVLRRPPVGANIKSGHDMSREYHILTALGSSQIKVPNTILMCADTSIIGSEFYLMEYVDGWILRSDIVENDIPSPSEMLSISQAFVHQFVTLHNTDYKKFGLESLTKEGNYIERQISGWSRRYYTAKTDEVASVENLIKWLDAHMPTQSGQSLIHNDFKYDNVILDKKTSDIKAILDWEMSTIGDPLMDVGSSLGYWINQDDPEWIHSIKLSPTNIPGNPTREELLQHYATLSGRDPGNGVFYFAYGMLKLAVIAQQIYARYKAGHSTNPKFAGLGMVVDVCGNMGLQSIAHKRLDRLF